MLWTLRAGTAAEEAREWLEWSGVPVWAVNGHAETRSWGGSPKAHANIYVDDRGLGMPLREDACVDWGRAGPMLVDAVRGLAEA